MANSLSASFPAFWSRMMQMNHLKKAVYVPIVNRAEEATLKKGNIVHRPYRSALTWNSMGSEGSYTRQDITDTDEYLTVDNTPEISFYIRDLDEIQSNYNTRQEFADDAATQLSNRIDAVVLGEVLNATSSVDDGDIGGTAGNAITLSTSNILKVMAAIDQKLNQQNVGLDGRYGVISPYFNAILLQYLAGKDTVGGDSYGLNGFVRRWYNNDLYLSNNSMFVATLNLATNPTDGDTIVINGVTLTWRTTQGSLAGSINICSDAANSLTNLVNFLNAPGTTVAEATNAGYNALSAANQALLKGLVASQAGTVLTIKFFGGSDIAVSETLTAAADVWLTQVQHLLFGRKGAIDLVIQKMPKTEVFHRDGYFGYDVASYTAFGVKTFFESAKEIVDVRINVA